MKFEEALVAMREGAKIWHPGMDDDEYFSGCYVSFPGEDFEEVKNTRDISIVRIKDGKQHPDMMPRLPFREQCDLIDKYPFLREKITYPTISLLLVMSDEWKILGEIK